MSHVREDCDFCQGEKGVADHRPNLRDRWVCSCPRSLAKLGVLRRRRVEDDNATALYGDGHFVVVYSQRRRTLTVGKLGGSYVTVPPVMQRAHHWAATLDLGGSAGQRNEIGGDRLSQLNCQ